MDYSILTNEELTKQLALCKKRYQSLLKEKLSLDLTRGRPSQEQLELSQPMLDYIATYKPAKNSDYRNYGQVEGIPELRAAIADMLDVDKENVIATSVSSLNLMFDVLARAFSFGVCGSTPWAKLPKVKFICPVPGYDRHFKMLESFGVEMICVPLLENGPDMDIVEQLVASDEAIKGIICVPRFSNPTGDVYSAQTVDRLVAMPTAAKDFRIFWDNAYFAHELYADAPVLKNIFDCAGDLDRVYMFMSTSKITMPSGGISALICTPKNVKSTLEFMGVQSLSYNKLVQYAHAQFLPNAAALRAHMEKHAEILRPKFERILALLDERLVGLPQVSWNHPRGGYFITIYAMPHTAKHIVDLCKKAGLTLTAAGSTYPYYRDDLDSVMRLAPTYIQPEQIDVAMDILMTSIEIATLERMIG